MAGPALNVLANPLLATLPPEQQQSLMQLQQQQALGQAMLGQGMQPIDVSGREVGGVGYRISPFEGASKVLNAYLGNRLMMGSLGKQAQLMGGMYGNAFGGAPQAATPASVAGATDAGGVDAGSAGSGSGVQSFPVPGLGQPQPSAQQLGAALTGAAPASAAGPMTLPGYTPQQSMQIYAMLGPQEYGKLLEARTAPTDATRMAWVAGIDPAQANAGALFKNNFVAPITGTGIFRDPRTMQPTAFNPSVPDGATPLFDASGNVAAVRGLPGAAGVASAMAAAKTAGEGSELPFTGVDAQGNPLPVTNRTAAANQPAPMRNNNPGALMPGGKLAQYPDMQTGLAELDKNLQSYGKQGVNTVESIISKWAPPSENNTQAYIQDVSQRLGIKPDQKIDLGNPLVRQSLSTAIALHENGPQGVFGGTPASSSSGGAIYGGAPLGAGAKASADATNQSNELSKKWTDLDAANREAQNTISYLQNIKAWGNKAATGPQADRLNYVNGLLSLAGSEKATDMVTANNLLDKYSNQIVARLSANGMGTNEARTILQSAYPNSHMTDAARNEAVDNLVGAQQMVQAKARLLAPLRNANDSAGYTNKELAFDQNADPRIFQYANIKDPAARQAFAKTLMQQDPSIPQKIQALQQLGVFK